ncbi:MAG: hypothetical protein HC915_08025 [Anaerolineae bacterium]|nr:hypothetical protein [Anaerolineae bacterium]
MAAEYDYIFNERQDVQARPENLALYQSILMLAVVVLIAVTAFIMGVMFERRTSPANSTELASFWEAWEIIEEEHYGEMPSVEDRKFGAINGW